MKDFITMKDHCNFCPFIKIANVLSGARIDLPDARSGDLRMKAMEKQIGRLSRENIPIGMLKGHLINFSRDTYFMVRVFGGI